MEKKRGQIGTEYLVMVGFVVFIVISIMGLAFFYSNSINDRIRVDQLNNFAGKVINSAESVFFAGEPSQVTISAYLPEGITGIQVLTNDLFFNVTTNNGQAEIAFPSKVPLSGSLSSSSGVKVIKIIAQSGGVAITEN